MSESYFFCLKPLYLKADHSFAKTIKPNTTYRFVLFKGIHLPLKIGIQKCDQMKTAIKSKLIGGKIDLNSPQLYFNVPYYSPTKNIAFNLHLYEAKPSLNQQQTQIATYRLMSTDCIKTYKNDKDNGYYQRYENCQLIKDLSVTFQLFIAKSKEALKQIVNGKSGSGQNNGHVVYSKHVGGGGGDDGVKSQSSRSRQIVRNQDGFISPRRRLERRQGHEGRLKSSRNNSRENSDVSDGGGSVTSSRRRRGFKKSPPSGRGERFLQAKKKASPPKIAGSDTRSSGAGKSNPKARSDASRSKGKNSEVSEADKKVYKYQPTNRLEYTDTRDVFDLKMAKNVPSGPGQGQSSQQSIGSPRNAVISPRSQGVVGSALSPKSNTQSNKHTAPYGKQNNFASNLQIKHTPDVFDIGPRNPNNKKTTESILKSVSPPSSGPVQKRQQQSGQGQVKGPTRYSPKKISDLPVNSPRAQKQPSQPIHTEKVLISTVEKITSQNKDESAPGQMRSIYSPKNKSSIAGSANQSSGFGSKISQAQSQAQALLQEGQNKLHDTKQIAQQMLHSVTKPLTSLRESDVHISMSGEQIRGGTVVNSRNGQKNTQNATTGSRGVGKSVKEQKKQTEGSNGQAMESLADENKLRNQVFYLAFLIVSGLMIYLVMNPTRKV